MTLSGTLVRKTFPRPPNYEIVPLCGRHLQIVIDLSSRSASENLGTPFAQRQPVDQHLVIICQRHKVKLLILPTSEAIELLSDRGRSRLNTEI